MKKRNLPLFSTLFSLLTLTLIRAGPVEGVQQLADGFGEVLVILIQFISDTILNINSFDEYLFAKILIFSIILLVTYTVIKKNTLFGGEKNKPIQWIISSAVSILAIRYLSDQFIEAILLQYGALAVAIGVFLPWAIFFFFLHQSGIGPFGRRLGWIVFATAFYSMWWLKDESLGDAKWIYIVATVFILISIFADRRIHRYFSYADFRGREKRLNEKAKYALEDELDVWRKRLSEGKVQPAVFKRHYEDITERLKELD